MQYGLIGEKLGHSFSVEIHKALGDYEYDLCPMPPEAVGEFMRKGDFAGINVTIPYKQTVIPYLDELDPAAAEIGAVNTVVNRAGRLIGYNTDVHGICALLGRLGADVKGATVAILGTGGTSRTAYAAAVMLGAERVVRVSRTPKGESVISYDALAQMACEVDVLINTTPVGMYPRQGETPVSLDGFTSLRAVADAVYNPLRTDLVLEAQARGIHAEGGLYMLVAQATRAAELFSGRTGASDRTDEVYERLAAQKRNIVLIGMPGCGKSSVGRALAEMLDRETVDSDLVVRELGGMDIPDIFTAMGESGFRDLESRAVEQISERGGRIVATGGGAVLRESNVRALRRNGVIVWLDRHPDNIRPTADRPLSRDRASLMTRYRERYPIYRAAAEITVDGNGSVEQTAEAVIKALREMKI